MPSIGLLDRRITLQRPTASQDGAGEMVPTWSTIDTVWARSENVTGSEPFEGEQFNAQRKQNFTIRYRSDLDETCQIVHDGDTYDIQAIMELGRREFLRIETIVLVPQ